VKYLPIKTVIRFQVSACITRQASLGKVRDFSALFPGMLHQLSDILEVAPNISTGWELAGCDRQLHIYNSQNRRLMNNENVPEA
jgi:hypothetical protein